MRPGDLPPGAYRFKVAVESEDLSTVGHADVYVVVSTGVLVETLEAEEFDISFLSELVATISAGFGEQQQPEVDLKRLDVFVDGMRASDDLT